MDQKLKERLFGAVIILSVLIVVLPILFKPPPDRFSAFYPEDSLHEEKVQNSIALALDNHLLKEKPSKPLMPISNPLVRKSIKPGARFSDEKAFVLRIGIFSNPQNAKSLVEKLHYKGYPAYSKVDISKGISITRVFVGPKKTQTDIKKMRDHLKKELNLEGIVLFIKTPELGVG